MNEKPDVAAMRKRADEAKARAAQRQASQEAQEKAERKEAEEKEKAEQADRKAKEEADAAAKAASLDDFLASVEKARKAARFVIPEPGAVEAALHVATHLIGNGWGALPISDQTKLPAAAGWQDTPLADRMAYCRAFLHPGYGVGVVGGQRAGLDEQGEQGEQLHTVLVDADILDGPTSMAVRATLPDMPLRIGRDPKFVGVIRARNRTAYSRDIKLVRTVNGVEEVAVIQLISKNIAAPVGSAEGGESHCKQAVWWGRHTSGKPYQHIHNSSGKTIFDYSPWTVPILNLAAWELSVIKAVAPLGWKVRAAAAGGAMREPENALGVLRDIEAAHMGAWARDTLKQECVALANMTAGSGRGSVVHEAMLKIAPVIAAGAFSEDEAEEIVTAAVGDWSAVERDFRRGCKALVFVAVNWAVKELARFRLEHGLDAPGRAPEARLDRLHEALCKQSEIQSIFGGV